MADILLVVVAFNLVTFLRGVSTEVFILPLVGPAIVFVLALHLIDGYGASSDMMSLDYGGAPHPLPHLRLHTRGVRAPIEPRRDHP
jgi:hypothetical protein